MAPNETAKLDQLLEQVSEHRSDFKVLCTELGCGHGDDKPSGRIPRLEKEQESHGRRIGRLEKFFYMLVGGVALVKGLAMLAESAKNIIEVLK